MAYQYQRIRTGATKPNPPSLKGFKLGKAKKKTTTTKKKKTSNQKKLKAKTYKV